MIISVRQWGAGRPRGPGIVLLQVLSNHADIQAVWHSELKIVTVAFRKPGSLASPIGRFEVDHSCLLMTRKIASELKTTASNPENEPLKLHVGVGGRKTAIELPGGNIAGLSVNATLRAA